MGIHRFVSCVIVVLAAGLVLAEDEADVAAQIQEVLGRAAGKLGAEFQPLPGSPKAFAAAISSGLATCDRIDLEVRVRDGGAIEVTCYPRVGGERLDPRRAKDREGLSGKLGASSPHIAPFAWSTDAERPIRASCSVRWEDASAADELERALLAAPAIDKQVAELMPALEPALSDDEIKAKLREANAADAATGRPPILAGIAPYLPELTPSATPGKSEFVKVVMNRRGAGLDAFRFRVPGDEGERRLVWAFAYPPGTASGWYIAPVNVDQPKLKGMYRGRKYEGAGLPAEHATILQRSETPLRAGAEYIIWFQFKVETPVDMYVALGCFPFSPSDRDRSDALEEALGLKPGR